jgi:hypothetical protein
VVGDHRVLEQVGADVDDAPEAAFAHAGNGCLDGVQGAAHAAAELGVEFLPRDRLGAGAGVAVEGKVRQCVVDHGRDRRPEMVAGGGQHRRDRGRIGDVGLQRQRVPSAQLRAQRFGRCATGAVVDDHARAGGGEGAGDGVAQPAPGAGDEHDLFGQRRVHGSLQQADTEGRRRGPRIAAADASSGAGPRCAWYRHVAAGADPRIDLDQPRGRKDGRSTKGTEAVNSAWEEETGIGWGQLPPSPSRAPFAGAPKAPAPRAP